MFSKLQFKNVHNNSSRDYDQIASGMSAILQSKKKKTLVLIEQLGKLPAMRCKTFDILIFCRKSFGQKIKMHIPYMIEVNVIYNCFV